MISDENFVTLQGWMITKLKLEGKELVAYALIYGFSQSTQNSFRGSYSYIAQWLGCCERTAFSVIESLEKKGLIAHTQTEKDGKTYNEYFIINRNQEELKKKEQPKKTKKVPLIDREPVNDIEKVEKKYLENYRDLYRAGKMEIETPIVNWQKSVMLIKNAISTIGLDKTIKAVDAGAKDEWVLKTGYALTVILSAGVITRLISSKNSGVGVGSGIDSADGDFPY